MIIIKLLILFIVIFIASSIEEHVSPITLIKRLFSQGTMAWIELLVISTLVLLPTILSTKILERFSAKLYSTHTKLKSILFMICSIFFWYYILMLLVEPIKNV